MTDPLVIDLRRRIWSLTQDVELINKAKRNIKLKDPVLYHEALLCNVEELCKPTKRKAKTYTVPDYVRDRYIKAYHDYQARNFEVWVKDGHTLDPKPIECDTNGLTAFIVRFLTWEGHFANRTSNEGRVIIVDGKPVRIKSSSKNGMQDIDTNLKHPAHPYGIPWKIEVKWAKDPHAIKQKEFGAKVEKTGGKYSVVRNHEDFIIQYDALMVRQKELF